MHNTRMTHLLPPPFDTINIWDPKYDYVMHDDHWLTSKWDPKCDKCKPVITSNDETTLTNNMDIAMTPISRPNTSTRAFVTPYNVTFSAKKFQDATQDLIDLNETFDLYRSCLAETPQLNNQEPISQHDTRDPQQMHRNQHRHQQSSSKIPKIPIRASK